MRVLFVLPRMVSGGVERVTLSLIRGLQQEDHACALGLRHTHGEFLNEARSLCDVHELAPNGLQQFVPNLARLLRAWRPTHVVTAFADIAVLTWLAMRIARVHPRWVHGVHNTHSSVTARSGTSGRSRFWIDLRAAAFVYRRADAIVAVSNGVRDEIVSGFRVPPDRVTTIYNPVVPDGQLQIVAEPRHDPAEPYSIVALGRLVHQKGFDILIEAMAQVPGTWRLDIWGEGNDRPMLQNRIEVRGLSDRIRLRGHTENPFSILRRADLFVLSSRWEGLPTVLIEALACQCQIVATDCRQGPREILEDGRFGQLVPPDAPVALGKAITEALRCHSYVYPSDLLQRASVFSVRASCDAWIALLKNGSGSNLHSSISQSLLNHPVSALRDVGR